MYQGSYDLILDLDEMRERAAAIIAEGRACAVDIETGYHGDPDKGASLRTETSLLAGISFTNSLKWSRYVPLGHDTGTNLDSREIAGIFWPLASARGADGKPLLVAHGAKFELRRMSRWFREELWDHPEHGPAVRRSNGYFPVRSDTMLESYAEAENRLHALKELTKATFGAVQLELEDLFPDKLTAEQKKQIRFNVLDPHDPRVIRYACEDTLYCLGHHRKRYPLLQRLLEESPGRGRGFIWKLEMAVLPVVCRMEDEGLWYDWLAMREQASRVKEFAARYMDEVREDFGELRGEALLPLFNFGSSQQLARLLYDECGMPVRHRTKTGRPGTDAKVALKSLSKEYPEVRKYLGWKRLTKLRRDFLESFEASYCYAEDRRAHPNHLQHGVPAGRFSHSEPNYAQSPKKYHYELRDGSVFDFNFRDMIGAPPGWIMLGFDLAQAELRAVAGIAREEKMFRAFEQDTDIHSVTAGLIYGKPPDQVTYEERDVGKTLGLAMLYGLTPNGLASRLGITLAEAAVLHAAWQAAYPRLEENRQDAIRQAAGDGYIITWWGRKVPIWDINSSNRRKRNAAQRTVGNAIVQGPATGDYMKIAMVRSDQALAKAGLLDDVRLAMNVHDALEWYVRDGVDLAAVIRVLGPAVVFPVPGWPPMKAEWHAGQRWGLVREVQVQPDGSLRFTDGAREDDGFEEDEEDEEDAPEYAEEAAVPAPPQLPRLQGCPVPAVPRRVAPPDGRDIRRPEPGAPARTVIVETRSVPGQQAAREFLSWCERVPGPHKVVLRMPRGDAVMRDTCGISPADEPEVSVILGGAVVRYHEDSVDLAALGAGLAL